MESEKKLKLVLKNETLYIPFKFDNIAKTKMSIFSQLMQNGHYHVQSNVSSVVLKSFINYWVYDQVPIITTEVFLEYLQLSEEFDLMKEVINEYRENQEKNKEYLKEIPHLKQKIEEQNIQMNQMKSQISTLMQYIKWLNFEIMKKNAEEEKDIQVIESTPMIVRGQYDTGAVQDTTYRLKNAKNKMFTMKKQMVENAKLKFPSLFAE